MLFSIFVFTFRSPTETFALNERVRSKEINKDFPSFGPGITSELKKETKQLPPTTPLILTLNSVTSLSYENTLGKGEKKSQLKLPL